MHPAQQTRSLVCLFIQFMLMTYSWSFILAPCYHPFQNRYENIKLPLPVQFAIKEESDVSAQGLVESLTKLVNFLSKSKNSDIHEIHRNMPSPRSPVELQTRIQNEYVINNYLWTGEIDVSSFEMECKFADPTLSFTGLDKYVTNVRNLRQIINALTQNCATTRSDLLDIKLNQVEGYVETKWNMVGTLVGLWWKPQINVIGRTKFWYRTTDNNRVRVYFYDEMWEIPAMQALLQIVTPMGQS